MKYTIEILPSAMKNLKKIDSAYVDKILKRIDFLAVEPRHHGSIKLSGQNSYRTRVGKYRIVYKVVDEKVLVSVVGVDHRKDIYR